MARRSGLYSSPVEALINLAPIPVLAPPGYVEWLLERRTVGDQRLEAKSRPRSIHEVNRADDPSWFHGSQTERNRLRAAVQRGEQLVYFIQAVGGGPIKIGVAKDPTARLAALQTASHDHLVIRKVTTGGVKRETELHGRFRAQRIRGEWFEACPQLVRLSGGSSA